MTSRVILAVGLAFPLAACAAPQQAPAAAAPAATAALAQREQAAPAVQAPAPADRAIAPAPAAPVPARAGQAAPAAAAQPLVKPAPAVAEPATQAPDRVGMSPAAPATSAHPATATAATGPAVPQPQPQAPAAAPAPAKPQPQAYPGPTAPATGSLLQTLLALVFVLALLAGLAWFMKRFGPRAGAGPANLRVVGAINIGGRERIMVVEVGDQWIVVGASPGRVNLLSTMPRQEGAQPSAALAANVPSGFADWLKQTIEKRNAK